MTEQVFINIYVWKQPLKYNEKYLIRVFDNIDASVKDRQNMRDSRDYKWEHSERTKIRK